MTASYDHPSPVAFKHRVRLHLLGKESDLIAENCNIEKENHDISVLSDLSQCSDVSAPAEDSCDDSFLDHELYMSAMMFASLDPNQMETKDDKDDSCHDDAMPLELESEMITEGLRYLGGYIATIFPQFKFLGSHGGRHME